MRRAKQQPITETSLLSAEAISRFGLDVKAFISYERTGVPPWNAVTAALYHALHAELLANGLNYGKAAERLGVAKRVVEWLADFERPPTMKTARLFPALRPLIEDQLRAAISSSVVVPDAATMDMRERAAKARELQAEAEKIHVDMMRVSRRDVLNGLVNLALLSQGIGKLAERVAHELVNGHDRVDPVVAMGIMQRYSISVNSLVNAAKTLVEVDKLQRELPSAIIAYESSGLSIAAAERVVGMADAAVKRARHLGLVVDNEEKKTG